MDIWMSTMGQCMQQQHLNNTTSIIKHPANNNWCTLVHPEREHPPRPVVKTEIAQQKAIYLKRLGTHPTQLTKSLIKVYNHTGLQRNDSPARCQDLGPFTIIL